MRYRFRPLLLLPAVAILVAAAMVGGGVVLSKRERTERVAGDDGVIVSFSEGLQDRILSLEALYRGHLETLCRSDLSDTFALRDALDGVVGVRQISTLDANGRVGLDLLASGVEDDGEEVPIPVFDRDGLPLGRSRFFKVEDWTSLGDGESGVSGWVGSGGDLFYFSNISTRRSVLVLVDREAVTDSIKASIGDWACDEMKRIFQGGGSLVLTVNDRTVVAVNDLSGKEPDLIRQLSSRFGAWQILSRDRRKEVIEYDLGIVVTAALLALVVALAGGIAFLHLNRALRLAEQRVSFVNQVSHELKSPLTNILLNADLAADGADARGRQRLARVQEETRRLARLIDNVLAFSRRDATPLPAPGPLALRPLVEEVAETFAPSLKRRGVEIVVQGGETTHVLADPDSLRQILGNLLSNIEKYAAVGGLADITLAEDDEAVILLVKDRGPGIPAREHERVFRPFQRLGDRPSEGVTGTGLGLAISRDLAIAMSGSLRLVPQDGPGATFELRLPAATAKVITFPDSRAS